MNIAAPPKVRGALLSDAAPRLQQRTALTAIAIMLLTFVCLWPTSTSLMVRWEDGIHRTYTHGYAIVALSLWLIWRDRSRLATAAACFPALAVLVATTLLWLIVWRAGLQIVHQTLLPAMTLIAVLACCGPAVTRQLLLPILYLYCAIPVWDAANPVLQWISVFAVRSLLRIADIPAFFDGNRFQIPAGSFEIADGCSGVHFFVVALSIAILYGAINRDVLRTRIKLIAFALALAMLTNWLRIFIIVVAGHLTDMQHRLIVGEHYSFGWFMFAGAMLLYFLVVRRWPLPAAAMVSGAASTSAPAAAAVALAVVTVAAGPAWAALDDNRAVDATAHRLPADVNGWTVHSAASDWRPLFKGADEDQRLEYRSQSVSVEAYRATYLFQLQGREILGHENSLMSGMRTLGQQADAAPSPWRASLGRDESGDQWVIVHVQRVDDVWAAPGVQAQLDYGVRSLFDAPLSSIIVLRSRCQPDCSAASASLRRFIAAAEMT